ncbi:MAG: peptidase M22 [Clostridia bacterium]|nr:peptidase M22 [Clostridia bacterium]
MLESKLILGIDTSNYTTSAALCTLEGDVVLNLKKLLPVAEGERGLRQSDALFAHTKNLPVIMDGVREFLDRNYPDREIVAVGYSKTPRDIEGSYMPCFLSGAAVASAVSATLGCQSFAFSHQSGHIMAALYSAGRLDLIENGERFAAFHVSGGTTEILLVTPKADGFSVELVGGTVDINAGQAIDRAGVMMGLGFPCGREMESLLADRDIPTVKTRISVRGLECNLSGLENLSISLYEKTGDKATVSAFCFDFVADTLFRLTENLREAYGNIPIIYAGGVMSNKRIGARLARFENTYFSAPEFSSDNAAGIALLCRKKYIDSLNC